MTAKRKIDEYISKTDDWRGSLLVEIRELIHEVDPDVEEEWKWNSPIFTYQGKMICSPGAFKKHVSLTFFQGSLLDDKGLFNGGTSSKNNRSINFNEGDKFNFEALKGLVRKAIELSKK